MQMANNTTQQHLRQPTFPFSRKNELPQVGFEPTTSHFPRQVLYASDITGIEVQSGKNKCQGGGN